MGELVMRVYGKKYVRASYTVEAVFLFPIILFLIIFMLQLSITWYENVQQASEDTQVLRELDTREYFLDAGTLKAMKEKVKSYGN